MRKLYNVLKVFLILVLIWCVWSIDELDSRTYDLKNYFNQIQAKHNKLTQVVKGIYDGLT